MSHTAVDLSATPAVEQLLEKARRENPRLEHHEVYFLTDLQRADWSPEMSGDGRGVPPPGQALAQAATLVVIDLGSRRPKTLP